MLFDFEIQRASRRCATTDRKLEPGEVFFSTLQAEGAEVVRRDYAREAWQGPSDSAIGWWKSRVPESESKRPKLAPNDVLLELFNHLADQPGQEGMRYVLTLLLIRRRVLRLEERAGQKKNDELAKLVVFCPSNDETYEVPEIVPDDCQIDAIQTELQGLLYADTA